MTEQPKNKQMKNDKIFLSSKKKTKQKFKLYQDHIVAEKNVGGRHFSKLINRNNNLIHSTSYANRQ